MADAASVRSFASAVSATAAPSRHTLIVRLTHWLTTACFVALLISGVEITLSHPRFYWGETGNVLTPALFQLPVPASRASVPTGYGFVLPDQNGWSRDLHFQAAWIVVFSGLLYIISGLFTQHVQRHLLPSGTDLNWPVLSKALASHLRFWAPSEMEAWSYNVLQRLTYSFVIFLLFPLLIWTGLAMSPAIVSAFPHMVTMLGGHQSARTLHFFGSVALVLFVLAHVVMVCRAGFKNRTLAMVTGRAAAPQQES